MELFDIDKEIHSCNKCLEMVEKFPDSKTVSIGIDKRIVILGEAPANNGWRKSGIAWYDVNHKLLPSGVVMQRLLDLVNIKLEDVYFLESIKCYPVDRKFLKKCIVICGCFFFKQLDVIKPKLILALGDAASRSILDIKYSIFCDVVGKRFIVNDMVIIPIYHPSPINPKNYSGNVDIFRELGDLL